MAQTRLKSLLMMALLVFGAAPAGAAQPPEPPRALPAAATGGPGLRVPAARIQSAPRRHTRQLASRVGDDARRPLLQDRTRAELTAKAAPAPLDAAVRDRLDALLDPFTGRGSRPAGRPGRLPDKAAAGWSQDRLLANATDMNDEYVSLAESPLTGNLYAVFAATDLGGSDRDIHIARSVDGGLSWNNWELPSMSADESMPDLAIDDAGYIHVVWIAEPGIVMRARSQAADDPVNWAWVHGLEAGEPLATPSIAVSGGGDFARVFIACAWNTVNWDLYAYEWTLLFMHSSDGGQNITHDWFVPDGYQDYWPDVTMDGPLVHFVNAEADYETGELEILIASDQHSGGFADVASLTGWTPNNCLFPRLAGQGNQVFVVYQHDWTDGFNTDGDIIYAYSWDGADTWYGPIEMIADPDESVGPTVFTRDGVVGCLWLHAPAGADEFDLAARLGSGGGHSELFGAMEIVTDFPRVEPQFHAIAGHVAPGTVHAAWIDRRDYASEGHNVYGSRRGAEPDLAAYAPADWSDAIVAAPRRGERTDSWLAAGDTTFVSFAFLNAGLADAAGSFAVELLLDGQPLAAWTVGGLATATWLPIEDVPLVIGAGDHVLAVRLDATDAVAEADEDNNLFSRTLTWVDGDPQLTLDSERVVISLAPETGQSQAMALAAAPPLVREVSVPVISPRLGAALDTAAPGDRLRVVIVPAQRLDAPALAGLLSGALPSVRRAAVLDAARGETARALERLRPVLDDLVAAGSADPPHPLWLSGSVAAAVSPLAAAQLAADPAVGSLWLDDRPSETFGTVATDAAKAAVRAWHLDRIGAPEAWARGYDGTGVLVGHVDSGVAYDHPDLAAHMWDGGATWPHHGWDAVDDDDDPYEGDLDYAHGTHTAGLVVGDGSAGTATGAAPGATLMALRAVPGYYEDLVEALQFGLDRGVDIFTLSGGWTNASEGVRVANRYNAELMLAAGVPWITAAGNGDNMGGHLGLPADIASPGDCPGPWYAPNGGATAVITVGATTITDEVWDGSSMGPARWDYDNPHGDSDYHDYPYPPGLMKPDLAAPGDALTSTITGGGYVSYSGTSMATPLVTGAATILLQAAPALTPAELARTLEESAVDVTASPAAPGRDNRSGAGLINLTAALDLVGGAAGGAVLTVRNTGALPLILSQVVDDGAWLEAVAPVDPVPPGGSVDLALAVDPSGLAPGVHEATLILVSNDPAGPHFVPVVLDYGSGLSGVDPETPAAAPARLVNRPNPFNPRTVLRFEVGGRAPVSLAVYDLRGRLVRQLVRGRLAAGPQEVVWDGRDEQGRAVGSGQYVARLREGGGAPVVRKLTLLR